MNRPNAKLYLLAVAILLAGCYRHEGHRRSARSASREQRATITRNWAASGITHVRVAEVDGSITVEAVPGSDISLVATAKGDLEIKKGEENDGLFETRLTGDTLRIGRHEREHKGIHFSFFWDRDDIRIDYVLRVPPTVSLSVNTVNGKIATKGVDGETKAVTVNGTIDIETTGTHALDATSVNGSVNAKFTQSFQGARFKTVNGGVQATLPQDASFAVNLSQVNGDFEASFPLSIHSNPGSRRVSGDVNGGEHELRIVTVNGDVELARLNGSR